MYQFQISCCSLHNKDIVFVEGLNNLIIRFVLKTICTREMRKQTFMDISMILVNLRQKRERLENANSESGAPRIGAWQSTGKSERHPAQKAWTPSRIEKQEHQHRW